MRRRRGFTIVELALVLITIAVLCAVAMPRYASSIARYRLDCAARKIAADVAMTQAYSRASSAARTIVFAPANGTYQINGLTNVDNGAANYSVSIAGEYSVTIFSANFGGAAQVIFDGFGMPSSAGSIVLKSNGEQRTVSVEAASGTVSIQ